MNNEEIIQRIDESIKELCNDFCSNSTFFYTENDIVCYFYSIIQKNLSNFKTIDKDGFEHFLVHCEYPTPFRCHMKNDFELKNDEDRTDKNKKFQRGHYDIVILNPQFINQNNYETIKAQKYEKYKEQIFSNIDCYSPVVLYGIELMYSRDPLAYPSKGTDKEKGINQYVSEIIKDADKLSASKRFNSFMDKIKMLTFIKGSSKDVCSLLNTKISERDEIILCFAP